MREWIQQHEHRDVAEYLAAEPARRIDNQLQAAFNDADAARGRKVAKGLAAELERERPVRRRRPYVTASTICSRCAGSGRGTVSRARVNAPTPTTQTTTQGS